MFGKKKEEVMEENSVAVESAANEGNSEEVAGKESSKKAAKEGKKKKEKKFSLKGKINKKKVGIGIVAVIVVLIVASKIINALTPMSVTTVAAEIGDISQTVDTSGAISSQTTKVYFSDVNAKLGTYNVKMGDSVKAGDVLFTYDEADLAEKQELAKLNVSAAEGSYDNSVMIDKINCARYGEATMSLDILEQQIADWDTYVKAIEKNISDKKAALAKEGSLLQISLIDWSDEPYSEEYENLQKLIQENNYEQAHNKDIQIWERELADAKETLAEYKSYEAEMKSQMKSTELSKLTPGGKEEMEAKASISKIEAQNNYDNCMNVASGVCADFNGIVTTVDAVEGSTLAKGAQVLTLNSIDDVVINIKVTKYDLEKLEIGQKVDISVGGLSYEGCVDHINKMAEKNESGTSVVTATIKITNPDDKLTLGVDGKVKIHTGEVTGVVIVPNEVISYGSDGAFVYVVREGKLVMQPVEVGINNDMYSQILSGISENEQVVTGDTSYLEEGVKVTAVSQ